MVKHQLTSSASNSNRAWYALYTRPRFEKKVDKELQDLNIESFLPLKKVIKFWSDRKKTIDEPLFPSYVFVHADLKERYQAFQPPGVVRMVSFNGEPTRIPEEQIEAVRRILEAGYLPLVNNELSKGDQVEIIAGPLTGLQGYVSEHRGNNHFTIFIEGICQTVAVKIEASYLKSIEKTN